MEESTLPCRALDARITLPHLPHGSTGTCKADRRTTLPWFVAIQEDHSAHEVPEGGTWEELAAAQRALTPGPSSPYGPLPAYL